MRERLSLANEDLVASAESVFLMLDDREATGGEQA